MLKISKLSTAAEKLRRCELSPQGNILLGLFACGLGVDVCRGSLQHYKPGEQQGVVVKQESHKKLPGGRLKL
jgi:hypothetical protein